MNTEHIVSAFDDELMELNERIAGMGGHAERMVAQAKDALVRADAAMAQTIISHDEILDQAQREIDERAVSIIARRQPVAGDLREIIGAMRIAADLERVGDLGKSMAKRVVAVNETRQNIRFYRGLESLTELTLAQLRDALNCYATRDIESMVKIRDRDEDIDAMYTSLFRELLTYMMEDPRNISTCTHLLFCAKNIERIGDHATNVIEIVHYIVTGTQLSPDRPKEDLSHQVMMEAE